MAITNPYLVDQANAIQQTATQNLNNNVIPGINSSAEAAGGYGGSRNQLAQGVATGLTNQGVANATANLYGNQYQADQQNQIQRTQVGNQYNLGLGSLGLQNQQQGYNFYTQQRSLDQSGAQLGADLYNRGNAGYLGQATGITGIGNTQQQAPWNVLGQGSNVFNQYTGLGGSTVQTAQGSPLGGAVGGGLAGAQIANLGLGSAGVPPATSQYNAGGRFNNTNDGFYTNPQAGY